MLKTRFLLSFILIAFFAVVSSAQTLPEGRWHLKSYNLKQKIVLPIDITLNIHKDGKLGGKSGCNVYGGSYAFEESKLKITDIVSTMMACDESTMQFERSFYDTLRGASEFKLNDGVLTLTDPKTLTFMKFEMVDNPKDNK